MTRHAPGLARIERDVQRAAEQRPRGGGRSEGSTPSNSRHAFAKSRSPRPGCGLSRSSSSPSRRVGFAAAWSNAAATRDARGSSAEGRASSASAAPGAFGRRRVFVGGVALVVARVASGATRWDSFPKSFSHRSTKASICMRLTSSKKSPAACAWMIELTLKSTSKRTTHSAGPRPGLEAPGADEALEKASLDAALARDRLGGDGLATARALVNQGDVRDVAFVEEPEADLELRLEVGWGDATQHPRPRAEGDEILVLVHVRHHLEEPLGRVSHRLGGREGLGAHVVEIGHREERGGRGGGPLQGVARAPRPMPWSPIRHGGSRQRRRRAARRGGRHPVRCFAWDNLKGAARRPTPVESAAPQGSEDTAASCGPKGGFVQPSG